MRAFLSYIPKENSHSVADCAYKVAMFILDHAMFQKKENIE